MRAKTGGALRKVNTCIQGNTVAGNRFRQGNTKIRSERREGVRDFDRNPDGNPGGDGQSTEKAKMQEKTANLTLTNVRTGSIIRVLLLTNSEYYSFGGCIL